MTTREIPMPTLIHKFIVDFCKAYPDVMRKVASHEFGDLDSYFDDVRSCVQDDELYAHDGAHDTEFHLVRLPKCGCLIGTVALTIAEEKSCGREQMLQHHMWNGGYVLAGILERCGMPLEGWHRESLSKVGHLVADWAMDIRFAMKDEDFETDSEVTDNAQAEAIFQMRELINEQLGIQS